MKKHKWAESTDPHDESKCHACGIRRRFRCPPGSDYPAPSFSIDGATWHSTRPDCGDPLDPASAIVEGTPARKKALGKTVHGNAIYDVRMRKPGSEYFFTGGIAFADSRTGGLKVKLWACPVGGWDGEMWIFPQEGVVPPDKDKPE
jgi:hypothetical protein